MKIKITNYNIKAQNVKQNTRFAFVSDLHGCDNDPIIKMIDENNVDAILVGGDFVHNKLIYEEGFEFLRLASKICPTFCALGNHEMKYGGDIKTPVYKSGAMLLDDNYVKFRDINIGGLTTGYKSGERQGRVKNTPAPNVEWLNEFSKLDGYKLLISHHPEYYKRYIRATDVDLTLSGHAHGGQWRFFNMAFFAPGQGFFPRYTSGMYENRLIVGRGLGNPHKIPRINNAPEIIIIDIGR